MLERPAPFFTNVLWQAVAYERRRTGAADVDLLDRLAATAAAPEDPTRQHHWRVASLAGRVGLALGMTAVEADILRAAARYHDIGKIGIPASIVGKPEPLTDAERRLMQSHTLIGEQILSSRRSPVLRLATDIAAAHHEGWDGRGYPRQLAGTRISLPARIVGVCDAWDALTQPRPYRPACTEPEALTEIGCYAGARFDPTVVEALVRVLAGETSS